MAVFDIGICLGSIIMGPLADLWNYTSMYFAAGGIALASLVYFFLKAMGTRETAGD